MDSREKELGRHGIVTRNESRHRCPVRPPMLPGSPQKRLQLPEWQPSRLRIQVRPAIRALEQSAPPLKFLVGREVHAAVYSMPFSQLVPMVPMGCARLTALPYTGRRPPLSRTLPLGEAGMRPSPTASTQTTAGGPPQAHPGSGPSRRSRAGQDRCHLHHALETTRTLN